MLRYYRTTWASSSSNLFSPIFSKFHLVLRAFSRFHEPVFADSSSRRIPSEFIQQRVRDERRLWCLFDAEVALYRTCGRIEDRVWSLVTSVRVPRDTGEGFSDNFCLFIGDFCCLILATSYAYSQRRILSFASLQYATLAVSSLLLQEKIFQALIRCKMLACIFAQVCPSFTVISCIIFRVGKGRLILDKVWIWIKIKRKMNFMELNRELHDIRKYRNIVEV